jgi:hypothetical protein
MRNVLHVRGAESAIASSAAGSPSSGCNCTEEQQQLPYALAESSSSSPYAPSQRIVCMLPFLFLSLQDGVYDEQPTCGWYYTNGLKVDDSQGFVCQCDSGQIWDTTFGANTERT